jgi:hypothetical protein
MPSCAARQRARTATGPARAGAAGGLTAVPAARLRATSCRARHPCRGLVPGGPAVPEAAGRRAAGP